MRMLGALGISFVLGGIVSNKAKAKSPKKSFFFFFVQIESYLSRLAF